MSLAEDGLVLDGSSLTIEELYATRNPELKVSLSPKAKERILKHWTVVRNTVEDSQKKCNALIEKLAFFENKNELSQAELLEQEELELELTYNRIYGVNTGFGQLKTQAVKELSSMRELQTNIVRSHACGVGDLLSPELVRMMMVLRANTLARAQSGIRLETLERLLTLLNHNILPEVPSQGSVGASGDLAPLAHMSMILLGEGPICYQGKRWVSPRKDTSAPPEELVSLFESIGLPLYYELDYKEGLSLTNGTTCMMAFGVAAWCEAAHLFKVSLITSALSMEALLARTRAFDQVVHDQRPHPGQIDVARLLRELLAGSEFVNRWPHVHDAYSIRCVPQVMGAALEHLRHIRGILSIELNATVDDPLFFMEEDLVGMEPVDGRTERIHYEQGHFHGEPIAMAMDILKIVVAEIANISERRVQHLLDHHHNRDLSGCLQSPKALEEGAHSGLLIPQYTCAALVSENKILAHPACVDSIPTSANHEDHVSMGTIAARQAFQMIQNARKVVAIESMCAVQAIRLRFFSTKFKASKLGQRTKEFWEKLEGYFPLLEEDRYLAEDIERVEHFLSSLKDFDFPTLFPH